MGKSHRLPFQNSQNEYIEPLQIVHSDLWGPCPIQSTNGCRYYVSIINAFSRHTWIYFLKSKSELCQIFLRFKALVELHLNRKLKSFKIDWGGEIRPLTSFSSKMVSITRFHVLKHLNKMA